MTRLDSDSRPRRAGLVLILVAIGGLLLAWRLLPVDELLQDATQGITEMGTWGAVAFVGLYMAATLLLVPAAPLSVAAGVIFGLMRGALLTWAAATVAALLAFLIARYAARESIARRARRYSKFDAIDHAIAEGGWRIVALLRLSPLVPFSVSNYLFGLTAVRFGGYALATAAAILPGTFAYVYVGYAGRSVIGMRSPDTLGSARWVLITVGLTATVVATWYISRLARRILEERTRRDFAG